MCWVLVIREKEKGGVWNDVKVPRWMAEALMDTENAA